MAVDETYRTINYAERGGSNWRIGSGGQLVVESGGSMVIASAAGTLAFDSGATLSMTSGATIGLGGGDIAADDARRILVSEQGGTTVIEPVALATVLPTVNLPKNVRVVRIYGSDATQSASFWLTSVSAGRDVWIFLQGDSVGTFTNASTQVDVSTSGCILLDSVGAAISGFEMHTSLASDCGIHLVAIADNTWSIVSQFGDIDE